MVQILAPFNYLPYICINNKAINNNLKKYDMRLKIIKSQKALAYYVISKGRIFHTIKRYCCFDCVVYYKIVRKDVLSKNEQSTTDHTRPQDYILGEHFFTLAQAFENVGRFKKNKL